MIQYKLQKSRYTGEVNSVTIVGVITSIPFDPDNTDYQTYLKWLAEGNEPLPPDALPVDEPPDEVIE
jgi:hypothetical protein